MISGSEEAMKLLAVNLKVVFGDPKIFAVDFTPEGVGTEKFGWDDIVSEVGFIDDNGFDIFFGQVGDVQSLSGVDFNRGNQVLVSGEADSAWSEGG